MPNKELKNKLYNTGDNDSKEKYTTLAMRESRLNKAKKQGQETGDWTEFNRLGGDAELKRLEGIIHTAQNTNYSAKKTGMDTGRENQFIKNHEKDNGNHNPTGIGSAKNNIMSNSEVFNENISKEVLEIRYLIEYMNNNKAKI